jgi:Tol biopolymer transport system component
MRRRALLVVIGVLAMLGPAAHSATRGALPPFGYPLRQSPDCAGANFCPGDRLPVFSPDGGRIAFLRNADTGFDLMVTTSDGATSWVVTKNVALTQPVWADSSTLYYGCGPLVCRIEADPNAVAAPTLLSPPAGVPETVPVFSPDGRRVAYERRSPRGPTPVTPWSELVVADPALTQPAVLGGGPGQDSWWSPDWSPDSTQLAFVRGPTAVQGELWVVGADGTGAHRLAATVGGAGVQSVAGWPSPARIDVLTTSHELWSVDPATGTQALVDGGDVTAATDAGYGLFYLQRAADGSLALRTPAFLFDVFPDLVLGKGPSVQARPEAVSFSIAPTFAPAHVAYVSGGDCPTLLGVYVVSADGTGTKRITERCRRDGTDRADVVHGTSQTEAVYGHGGADTIDAGGGNDFVDGGEGNDTITGGQGDDRLIGGPGRDTISGGDGWDAIVSRDGEVDHVSCGPGRDIVWADPADVVAADCEVVLREAVPVFPTQGTIAMSCYGRSTPSISRTSATGGAVRRVTTSTFIVGYPRWSPDRTQIAYTLGATPGAIWLHRIGVTMDRRIPVKTTDEASWFPDGTLLVTNRHGEGTTFAKVTTSGRATPLFTLREPVVTPELSHDGKRIAFSEPQGGIWTIGVGGRGLAGVTAAGTGLAPRWSADDRRLAFIDDSDTLRTIDLATGKTREVSAGDNQPFTYAWAPSGPWLVAGEEHDYDCGDPTGPCTANDLWIVDVDTGAQKRIYRGNLDISSVDWR